jgi:hypothetical protein
MADEIYDDIDTFEDEPEMDGEPMAEETPTEVPVETEDNIYEEILAKIQEFVDARNWLGLTKYMADVGTVVGQDSVKSPKFSE